MLEDKFVAEPVVILLIELKAVVICKSELPGYARLTEQSTEDVV